MIPLLPVPGVTVPTHGSAFDVNNNDVVCSFGHALEGGVPGAIVMHDAQSVTPIAPNGNAHALNDRGQTIGTSNDRAFRWDPDSSGSTRRRLGFLRENGAMIGINTLLAPDQDWEITEVVAIGDNGVITAYGTQNGQQRPLLLLLNP